jgi:hypothetical protein
MTRDEFSQLEKLLQKLYLERFNNYLTNRKFAEDYGLEILEAEHFIRLGHIVHERLVKKHKQEGDHEYR